MKKFLQFDIPFASLKEGAHQFEYEIDKTFFDQFEATFVKDGKLKVSLAFFKQPNVCTLDFKINGHAVSDCDRCLESMELPVEAEQQLLLKFSEDPREEEEIIYLLSGTEKFNVAHYIYEFILLTIPIRKVHPEKEDGSWGCDPEIASYFDTTNDDEEDNDNDNDQNSLWNELQKFKE